ncbi:MAG: CRISPR-associated helicase Cas3' [bacterium]
MKYHEDILAKRREDGSFQSLEEHTRDCLFVLEELMRRPTFRTFCQRWQIEEKRARENLRWALRLHDIGKASLEFQEALKENRKAPVSHRLVALPLAYEILKEKGVKDIMGEDEPTLILALILAHHSALHSSIFASEPDIPIKPHPSLSQSPVYIKDAKIILQALQELIHKKIEEWGETKLKSIFSYFLSLVKLSDWLASKAFSEKKNIQIPTLIPPNKEDILQNRTPYPFQLALSSTSHPFLILRAPCGRGKTEGALLWFLNLWEKGWAERLIFVMPTQVTSNSMRERLRRIFGEEVALYHGRSFLEQMELNKLKFQTQGMDIDEEEFLPLLREENLWGEVMGKPIVVTTVDHILFSFLHGFPQADFAFGNLQTAALVFDEVHCYDYLMLSHLRETFCLLREMKIPHLLMSATLPDFLLQELRIRDYHLIEDEEGKGKVRFSLRKREEFLVDRDGNLSEEVLEEIKGRNGKGEKQFLILNTVRRAQRVYLRLKKEGLPCLLIHSRFAYAHRRKKERAIMERLQKDEPFILVATQVIEVSLDISSQTMFTELAPIDALVQRAGRLNRRGEEGEYILYIFLPEDENPYRERKEIMERSWELLEERAFSQGELIELTSRAYEGERLEKVSLLPRLFRETVIFGHSVEEIRFSEEEGRAFRTREIEVPTIDVVPRDVIPSCEGGLSLSFVLSHLVPVPVWWIASSQREGKGLFCPLEVGRRVFLVCNLPYDEEIGFYEEKIGETEVAMRGVMID